MSTLIFESKKINNKKQFDIYNSPRVKNPIKLMIDAPNRFNLFKNKFCESKKFPKVLQIGKNIKIINNHFELKRQKTKEELPNLRYNANKKGNNLILSRNILNSPKYKENEIFFPREMNTSSSIKFNNRIKNKEKSPLISHSIDIINNNPYNNKKRSLQIIIRGEKDKDRVINKNNDNTDDNFLINKYYNILPINFKLSGKQEMKLKNKYNNRKLSCFSEQKNILNSLEKNSCYINNNIKIKKRNVFEDSCKDLNKKGNKLFIQIDLENNDTIYNNKLYKELFDEYNKKKIINLKNINLSHYNKNGTLYYNNKMNNYYKDNIECISDDELKEYYVNKCNIILEYAYKEDRNGLHKINMEDKGKSILNFNNDINKLLFCLFDGHGGDMVSSYLQKNFGEKMKVYANISGYKEIDFEKLFKEIDEEFQTCKYYNTGSTATIIYITKDIKNKIILYCINIGDTKCILTQTNGSRKLSYDDLVNDQNEHNRIINEGGFIKNGRVCGQLMVSRAFGDWDYKKYGLICSPHVTKIEIDDKCKFIILASDGVWDVLDDLDVYKYSLMAENSKKLCDDIIQNSLDRNSTDNISCFAIKLNE